MRKARLRSAGGHDDVVSLDIDVVTLVILAQLLAQRQQPFRRTVFQDLTVDMLEGFQPFGGSRDVGLADIQTVDLHAPGYGLVGQGDETAYGGCGHDCATL